MDKDVCCLLFEGGFPVKLRPKPYQPLGETVVRYYIEPRPCDYERICPFFQKHGHCPTMEEIKAAYHISS